MTAPSAVLPRSTGTKPASAIKPATAALVDVRPSLTPAMTTGMLKAR
jgi:hypothetical protein